MKSQRELQALHKRITTLKEQRSLAWLDWHELTDKENKTKEDTKHLANTFKLINSLTYEIGGLELDFKDLKEQVITEIINSK